MRIALYGPCGAGKSTARRLLADELTARGHRVGHLRLAEPLYGLQRTVYAFAGAPLPDPDAQDGQLLNALGQQVRRIRPGALTDDFAARVRALTARHPDRVIVCDDGRGQDADALAELGFVFVEVRAPEELRRVRLAARGDLSAGDPKHVTETPVTAEPDHVLVNDGSWDVLAARVRALAETLRAVPAEGAR